MCGAAVHSAAVAHLSASKSAAERKSPIKARGDLMIEPIQEHAGEPTRDIAPALTPPRALHINLVHHQVELTFRAALISIGRADPTSDFVPDLDLSRYGGQERGVSRRHATIRWNDGGYVISDTHSSNGTWLNGERLEPGQPCPVWSSATIRFGGLVVQLTIAD